MKFSVSVYSFMQYIQDGRLTPFSCIKKVKEMGFDAIEYVDFVFPKDEDPAEYAKKLRAEADRVGLAISNYAVGADLLGGSEGNLEAEVERLKAQVDIAAILGCPTMRHDTIFAYSDSEQNLPWIRQCPGAPGKGLPGRDGVCGTEGHQDHDGEPRLHLSGQPAGGEADQHGGQR